jgi:hypothetical protein
MIKSQFRLDPTMPQRSNFATDVYLSIIRRSRLFVSIKPLKHEPAPMLIHRLRHSDLVNERGLRSQLPVINNSIDPKPI